MMEVSAFALLTWPTAAIALTWSLLWLLAKVVEPSHDPREPPLVRSRVPLLGHVSGMWQQGPKYFQSTTALTKAPIHTLNFFNGKVYVITSSSIVSLVSRNSKSISFNPFIAEIGIRLTQASNDAREIIERNIDGSLGRDSYVLEIHDLTVAAMTPSPEMNRISIVMLRDAWDRFLQPLEESGPQKLSLQAVLRHIISMSSTTALYGAETNPFLLDPSLEDSFWDFDANLNMLLLDVHPEWTARKGHRARVHIAQAFEKYFRNNPVGKSSSLAEARYSIAQKHGLSLLDTGRLEVGTLIGILVNTVPTTFWLVCHIFSSPDVLNDIRQEIEEHAVVTGPLGETKLNMEKVRSHCLLLQSTLQETLRTYSEGASVRLVVEDTTIDNRFLLKKGSVLQMPNSVLHRDKSAWGDTSFDPRRFLKDRRGEKSQSTGTTSAGSFRAFGGGSTLCPGRHFAAMEITGLVAMLVWRFDIRPLQTHGDGRWIFPKPKQDSVVESVYHPDHDLQVHVASRAAKIEKQPFWKIVFE